MRQLLIFAFLFAFIACDNRIGSKGHKDLNGSVAKIDNKLFTEFLDSLPSHEVPIHLVCGLPGYTWTDKFKKYEEFVPDKYDAVYGLVGMTRDFKCIMFAQVGDDIYPTLFTFDNDGKIIDSLSLILSPCGAADEYLIPHSVATIDRDLKITLQDTLKYIHYPDSTNEYVLDSIKTSKIVYFIHKNGRIIKE